MISLEKRIILKPLQKLPKKSHPILGILSITNDCIGNDQKVLYCWSQFATTSTLITLFNKGPEFLF